MRVDLVTTPGQPTLRVLSIGWSSRPIDSPLAGWKTARGIAVGSTWKRYAAAYPRYELLFGFTGLPTLDVATPVPDGRDGIVRASFNATPAEADPRGLAGPHRGHGDHPPRHRLHARRGAGTGPLGEPYGARITDFMHDLAYYSPLRFRSVAIGELVLSAVAATGAEDARCYVQGGEAVCVPYDLRSWPVDLTLGLATVDAVALQVTVLSPQCRHCRPYRLVLS